MRLVCQEAILKNFLEPSRTWEQTVWGRIDQGRRELAVALGRDVSSEKLAELIGLSGASLNGWKRGSQPKKEHLEALERVFAKAHLFHLSARYLDYGEGNQLSKSPPVHLRKSEGKAGREANRA